VPVSLNYCANKTLGSSSEYIGILIEWHQCYTLSQDMPLAFLEYIYCPINFWTIVLVRFFGVDFYRFFPKAKFNSHNEIKTTERYKT
jgi:hypothetical protein